MVKRVMQAVVAMLVAAGVAWLFVRSVHNSRSEPYMLSPEHLRGWTLAVDPAPEASGVVLALQPPQAMSPRLFQQVFSRAMESLSAPSSPGMPLVLQQEFAQAFSGRIAPDALLAAARDAGLEDAPIEPLCLAHKRESTAGATRQLYFALFQTPAFHAFRARAAALLQAAGGATSAFDPNALHPMVIVGAADAGFRRWLPMAGDPQQHCIAPIQVSR